MQKSIQSYFQARPGTLRVGAKVESLKTSKCGEVVKLSRNDKGVSEATVLLANGERMVGSSIIGKDFNLREDAGDGSGKDSKWVSPTKKPPETIPKPRSPAEKSPAGTRKVQDIISPSSKSLDSLRLQSPNRSHNALASSSSPLALSVSPPTIRKGKETEGKGGSSRQQASPSSNQGKQQALKGATAPAEASKKSFWWWLEDQHIKDANQRRPTDPDYDASSVFVPPDSFREMTNFQQQYWNIKKCNFDTLILCKLGKFYELYERDALVGHKELNLNFTHGGRDPKNPRRMMCVGVPEACVEATASKIVALGYKVGLVEEMEKATSMKKIADGRKVCERSLRKMFTPGTLCDEELIGTHESRPLVSVFLLEESRTSDDPHLQLGFCLVDCTTGRLLVGSSDVNDFEVLLRQYTPYEVLHPRGRMSSFLKNIIRRCVPAASWTSLPMGIKEDELAANAVGGVLSYLEKIGKSTSVLAMRKLEFLEEVRTTASRHMLLDSQTLSGLNVLEHPQEKRRGEATCLWHYIDRAATSFGKRLLRWWIARPLVRREDIRARLDAVQNLQLEDLAGQLQQLMAKMPDLERKLARVRQHSRRQEEEQGVAEASATQRRMVREVVQLLDGFRLVQGVAEMLAERQEEISSPLLLSLLRNLPDTSSVIESVSSKFDMPLAREKGSLSLLPGFDRSLDDSLRRKEDVDKQLNEYLLEEKKRTSCYKMRFASSSKDPFLLEVPADFPSSSVPDHFELHSANKSCRRYMTERLRGLLVQLEGVKEEADDLHRRAMGMLCCELDGSFPLLSRAVACMAELDALCSLARASVSSDGLPMCKPEVLEEEEGGGSGAPVLQVKGMRHPFLAGSGGTFIPNDIELGGGTSCLLLTGPNMGGKSTTLRLACFSVILAQIGCYVPAEIMRFSPVDQVLTRLGAGDDILRGLSTFMVEMRDVSAMLSSSSRHSLVIIDELGRGTSTFDGLAIAYAVLKDLVDRVGCRTLLSTHYHLLVDEFREDSRVAPMHMACRVEEETDRLIMLYKLTPSACSRSFGLECARAAGIPQELLGRAAEASRGLEVSTRSKRKREDPPSSSPSKRSCKESARARSPQLSSFRRIWQEIPQGDRALSGKEALMAFNTLTRLWVEQS
ncbi:hypothetical protein GUITHDRAFT_99074 [Guillardia theta CCMP2712]|uniref:DNA mismatch repair protein n=3 Tax=Guillardia theta TaxID=55529 RepID=L1K3Y7_GUITC|nr:hypothetical protein GUITHDRAFT_99074 [Guillardia theta CCMP2712]EKX55294.1 hypothetical protein GUITHDRAFT_99074 [Guillardia theta CCMP2712]|eukprot:XP_005842274.1 hypothetical protein GUITHDRAFT_99074 [Guillardia theta CCMP2712]